MLNLHKFEFVNHLKKNYTYKNTTIYMYFDPRNSMVASMFNVYIFIFVQQLF